MGTFRGARGALTRAAAAVLVLSAASCTQKRERSAGEGVHPAGWDDRESESFHARWLQDRRASHGDEIAKIGECRKCHGDDYKGGAVGVSCTTSGCHTQKGGPEFCGTCHGGEAGPMPTTGAAAGAHQVHQAFCELCHQVPAKLDSPGHADGRVDVIFAGLAIANDSPAAYDTASKSCSDVYCHARSTVEWKAPTGEVPCSFCHEAPPAQSHDRWKRIATAESCATCHPAPEEPKIAGAHIDTKLEVNADIACWTCHGTEASKGAPAPALDGSTDPTSPRVGAHDRHLNAALADRIGAVVTCDRCHLVPTTLGAAGHVHGADGKLDTTTAVNVALPKNGVYDPVNQTCVVSCHFDKFQDPPKWTDDSGAARSCEGGCHGFPPPFLRTGTPHTYAEPTLSACLACHPFSPTTHVDGLTELLP